MFPSLYILRHYEFHVSVLKHVPSLFIWNHIHFLPSRVSWKQKKCAQSLSEPWARRLHRFPKNTTEPFLPALAVPMHSFSQHSRGLPCNYLLLNFNMTPFLLLNKCQSCSDRSFLSFSQDLPVQKQSDLVQDFYQSFAEYFSSQYKSFQHLFGGLFILNLRL